MSSVRQQALRCDAAVNCEMAHNCSTQDSHIETVKLLIKAGTNPNVAVLWGASHLHIAAREGHLEVMRLLIKEAGANPNVAHEEDRRTPLRFAAENGDTDSVRLLLEAGADPNLTDDSGISPLHMAALCASDCIKLLLAAGADPNVTCEDRFTPLHWASYAPYQKGTSMSLPDVCHLLIAYGADISMKNKNGRTPLDIATYRISETFDRERGTSVAEERVSMLEFLKKVNDTRFFFKRAHVKEGNDSKLSDAEELHEVEEEQDS